MNNRLPGFLTLGLGLIVLLTGLVPSFLSGQEKAKPHVVIPEASDVAKINFVAEKLFPGGPFELNLTRPEEIKPLITLLRDVGWDYSKSGNAAARKWATAARMTVTQKNKAELHFGLPIDNIIARDRFWGMDQKKLEAIIKQLRVPAK